jgi:hypothetical protein
MTISTQPSRAAALPSSISTQLPRISFEAFDLPKSNQKILGAPHVPGTVSPLALRPIEQDREDISLDDVIDTIKSLQAQDGTLTKKLALHGTLLFRGLPIHNAHDFSKFAHAFGYNPHEIIGIVVDRPTLAPNIAPVLKSAPLRQNAYLVLHVIL